MSTVVRPAPTAAGSIPTTFGTVLAPPIGSANPYCIASAPTGIPARVVIDNVGAATAFIGAEPGHVSPSPPLGAPNIATCYLLRSNCQVVFVLAGGQKLFAVGATQLSMSVSAALPIDRG